MQQTAGYGDAPEPGSALPTVTNDGSASALQPDNDLGIPATDNDGINQTNVRPANTVAPSAVNTGQYHGKEELEVPSENPSSSTVGTTQEHAAGALGHAMESGCQTDAVNFTEQMQRLRARLQSVVQGVREVAQSLDEPHSLIANVRDQLQHRHDSSARRSTPIDMTSPAMYSSAGASHRRSLPASPYASPLHAAAVAISPLMSTRAGRQGYHPTMLRQEFMSGSSAASLYASVDVGPGRATVSDVAVSTEDMAARLALTYSTVSGGGSPLRTSMQNVSLTTSGDETGAIGSSGGGGGNGHSSASVRARVAAVERRARSAGGMPDLLPGSSPYALTYHLPVVSENGPDSGTMSTDGLGQTPSEVLADHDNNDSRPGAGEEGQSPTEAVADAPVAAPAGGHGGTRDGGQDEGTDTPEQDSRSRGDGTEPFALPDGFPTRGISTYLSTGGDAWRGSTGRSSSTYPMAHALSRASSTASGSCAVAHTSTATSTDDSTPGAQGSSGDPRLFAASTNAAAAAAYLREHPEMLKELWTLRARVRLQESELDALIKQLSTKNAQLDAAQTAVQQKERELSAITRRLSGVLAKLQSFQAAHNLQHQHYQRQQALVASHPLNSSVSSPATFSQLQLQQQQEQGEDNGGPSDDVRQAALHGDPSWDSPQPAASPSYPHTPTTATITAASMLGAIAADGAPHSRPAVRRLFAEPSATPDQGTAASDAALPAPDNAVVYPLSLDGGVASRSDDRDQWRFAAIEPRLISLDFEQPPSPSVWAGSSLVSHQVRGGTEQEVSSEGGIRQSLVYAQRVVPDAESNAPASIARSSSRGGWFGGLAKLLLQVAPSIICVALLLRDPAVRRGLTHLWEQFGGGSNAGTGLNGRSQKRAGTLPPGRAAEVAAAARAAPLDASRYAAVLRIAGSVGEAFESRSSAECKALWCPVVRPPSSKTVLYY